MTLRARAACAAAVCGLAVLALAGCAGGDETQDPGGDTAVATGPEDAGGTGTGDQATATGPPKDLVSAAQLIQAELDEALAELRNVESLDDLREDLADTTAQAEGWEEQLAALPQEPELAEQRAALEQGLAQLSSSLEELSLRTEEATAEDLGTLAQQLTPGNLEGSEDVRAALEALLEQG